MLLSLSDEIWSRLYGPYGIEGVAPILSSLASDWDEEIANDLFWEKLHHQGDVYPVTFAALPWLWKKFNEGEKANRNLLAFLAHVLTCVTSSEANACIRNGSKGKYRGLSLNIQDHAFEWIPDADRLMSGDMVILRHLEDWFSEEAPKIADACMEAVPTDDKPLARELLTGFAAFRGSEMVANLISFWGDDCDLEDVYDCVQLSEHDLVFLQTLIPQIQGKNPELAEFLVEFSGIDIAS